MGRRQNVLGQLSGFSLLRGKGVQRNLLTFDINNIFNVTDLPKILQIIFDHRLYSLATKTLQVSVSSFCNICSKIAAQI